MIPTATDPGKARRLRQLVYAMAIVLTFEGIARKAAPPGFGIPLFLLKDVLTAIMAFYVLRMPMPPILQSLWNAYMMVAVLLVPLIIMTAIHDPLLAVFGAKQYLLFPIVGFATFLAFENSKWVVILTFYRRISLLLLPTALLAVIQVRLPHNSWLNMSVNGESMERFSAEGVLRVSSTFSFVAQYCIFLNAQMFIIFIAMHGWVQQSLKWKFLLLLLLPAMVVSSFITGSRGAVVANVGIIVLALILSALKFKIRSVFQIGAAMVAMYLAVLAFNYFLPESTVAYSARENGHLIGLSQEMRDRIFGSYLHLDRSLMTFGGYGLGVMSNGSDILSFYAATWRAKYWTETDFVTTVFEGGFYLVVVWYGFRFFVIIVTLRHFLANVSENLSVPVAFCQAFVMIIGAFGTLALQPPIAIWWWFGVGTTMLFSWKCVGPPESDEKPEEPPPPPARKIRGRSLYADVIHSRK